MRPLRGLQETRVATREESGVLGRTFPQANLSFNLNRRYNGGKSTTLLARGSKERSPGSLEK